MNSTTHSASAHPPGLRVLFFAELWERFSYYGMRALLVLFMVEQIEHGGLALNDASAAAIYGLYTAGVYLMALPGGWLADRWLGARSAVWYGGIVIMLGHFTLAVPETWSFFPGLLLVVLGTGLLKPNISAMVGQLYGRDDAARRDSGFVIFYMGINIGAALGPLVCSTLGEGDYGWHAGFAAAGVGMFLGLAVYRFGYRWLPVTGAVSQPFSRPVASGLALLALAFAALAIAMQYTDLTAVGLARYASVAILATFILYLLFLLFFSGLTRRERDNVTGIAILCLISAIFWSGFEQAGSSFNLFAERYTERALGAFEIPAGWFQSLNPLFIILLAPFYSALWLFLARRHLNPSTPVKFGIALLVLAAGFVVIMTAAQIIVSSGERVLPVWLLTTYFLHTAAELLLSPVGLSAVSGYAPRHFIGRMMGLWFMTAALGNLLAGLFASSVDSSQLATLPALYLRIAVMGCGVGLAVLLFSSKIKRLLD